MFKRFSLITMTKCPIGIYKKKIKKAVLNKARQGSGSQKACKLQLLHGCVGWCREARERQAPSHRIENKTPPAFSGGKACRAICEEQAQGKYHRVANHWLQSKWANWYKTRLKPWPLQSGAGYMPYPAHESIEFLPTGEISNLPNVGWSAQHTCAVGMCRCHLKGYHSKPIRIPCSEIMYGLPTYPCCCNSQATVAKSQVSGAEGEELTRSILLSYFFLGRSCSLPLSHAIGLKLPDLRVWAESQALKLHPRPTTQIGHTLLPIWVLELYHVTARQTLQSMPHILSCCHPTTPL